MVTLGYAYAFNALKFRILDTLYKAEKPLTARDIGFETGIHHTRISSAMARYQKIQKKNGTVIKLPYIRRLEQRGVNNAYRYTITKSGREAYKDYLSRVKDGESLNRIKVPDHEVDEDIVPEFEANISQYIRITKKGREQGLSKPEHALHIESMLRHHDIISERKRRKQEVQVVKTPEAKTI